VNASSTTATESVVVPANGAGVGTFYVVATVPSLPPVAPGSSGAPSAPTVSAKAPFGTTKPARVLRSAKQAIAVPINSSQLAVTGTNWGPLLLGALVLISFGMLLLAISRTEIVPLGMIEPLPDRQSGDRKGPSSKTEGTKDSPL
jgi:hypothetical protein